MFAAVTSVALVGVQPQPVRVEAHVGTGRKEPFQLVGLPDAAVREAKERVRAAIASSAFEFPQRRVVVNLSPADLPKGGSAYDLPIALAILAAARLVRPGAANVVALGELALDGTVRSARGGLGAALVARDAGSRCVLPTAAAEEASVAHGVDVRAVADLAEAISVALGETRTRRCPSSCLSNTSWLRRRSAACWPSPAGRPNAGRRTAIPAGRLGRGLSGGNRTYKKQPTRKLS